MGQVCSSYSGCNPDSSVFHLEILVGTETSPSGSNPAAQGTENL